MSKNKNNKAKKSSGPQLPGVKLRQAREACRLGQIDIARRLRLGLPVVRALEEDDYEHLPVATFVRGYIRNYALEVNLNPQPLVDQYNQYLASLEPEKPAEISEKPTKSWNPSQPWLQYVGILSVFILILVIWIWIEGDGASSEPSDDERVVLDPSRIAKLSGQSKEYIETEVRPEPQSNANASTSSTDRSSKTMGPMPYDEHASESSRPVAASLEDVGDAAQNAASQSSQAGEPGAPKVSIDVRENSWVVVHDGNGKRILYQLARAGENHQLKGLPPYRILLGNASGVSVYVGDEVLDIRPFVKGNVANILVGKAQLEP